MSVIRKVFSIFKKPWFLWFLVVIVLSLLVWFLLPLIKSGDFQPFASPWSRLLIILGFVLIWGISNIFSQRKEDRKEEAEKQNQELVSLGKLPDTKTVKQTVRALRLRFLKALKLVNQGAYHKGLFKRVNYKLPWYIVLGATGSGKTSMLKNSSVEFYQQYANEINVIKEGIDPLCDWHFAQEAVYIDVKGSVVENQTTGCIENHIWSELLELLKHNRPRKPLSGVIYTISISQLMSMTEEERRQTAFAFRQRLKKLDKTLGVDCPVYCMVTHMDQLAGFVETYASITGTDRGSINGVVFPLDEENAMNYFVKEYDRVVGRVRDNVLMRMQLNEWDHHRCGLIASYSMQLAYIKDVVKNFVIDLYQQNGYYDQTFLRAVLFSSNCQNGTPTDYIADKVNPAMGLDVQPLAELYSKETSYFVSEFLRTILLEEKNVIRLSYTARKHLRFFKGFVYAVAGGLVVAGIGVWWGAYSKNVNMMAEVDSLMDNLKVKITLPQYQGSLSNRLPILNTMNEIWVALDPRTKTWSYHWGVFQGGIVLKPFNRIYLGQLQEYYLPYIKASLATNIKQSMNNQYDLYNNLQAYLMVSRPGHLLAPYVEDWMRQYWMNEYAYDQLYRISLYSNLNALLELNKINTPIDKDLVYKARQKLHDITLAQLAYYNLLKDVGDDTDSIIKMEMMLDANFDEVFGESTHQFDVLKLYTKSGYINLFQKYLYDAITNIDQAWWVLGVDKPKKLNLQQQEQIKQGVISLYMSDYTDFWMKALSRLSIVKFSSLQQADGVLQTLTTDYSPILKLLNIIKENTEIQEYNKMMFVPFEDQNKDKVKDIQSRVEKTFAPLNKMVTVVDMPSSDKDAKDKGSTTTSAKMPYDVIETSINKLYDKVHKLELAQNPTQACYNFALQTMSKPSASNPIQNLLNIAQSTPQPLKRWLNQIADNTWSVILQEASGQIQTLWSSQVIPKYNALIAGRYPVNKNATSEIQLNDFEQFFGPKGVIESFFHKYLDPFVDQDGQDWQWKAIHGGKIQLSTQVLSLVQRSQAISDAFFGASSTPNLEFTISPTSLDGTSQMMKITLNGQVVTYAHGPHQFIMMKWPQVVSYPTAQLAFITINGQTVARTEPGLWGWFRLLDSLKISKGLSPTEFKATAKFGGHSGSFIVQTKGWVNPFYPNLLRGYKLPSKIE